jgi:hypothetical protein
MFIRFLDDESSRSQMTYPQAKIALEPPPGAVKVLPLLPDGAPTL